MTTKTRPAGNFQERLLPNYIGNVLAIVQAVRKYQKTARQIIVHKQKWIPGLSPYLAPYLFRLESPVGPTKPHGLTIVLAHNRKKPTVLERSLLRAGITDYEVARFESGGKWRNVNKITGLIGLLKAMESSTDHVLYIDSDDAVIRDNPLKVLNFLTDYQCEVLFSATRYELGYEHNPVAKKWAQDMALASGWPGWYLNSGVFIGELNTVIELLEAAAPYIVKNEDDVAEISRKQFLCPLNDGPVKLPDDSNSDQKLFRYLHPQFYPRVKIDYEYKLAYRNTR